MYFPILRGKRNELLALREIKQTLSAGSATFPIIEPIKAATGDLKRCLCELDEAEVENILLYNPSCGELKNNRRAMTDIVSAIIKETTHTHFAYWIDEGTTLNEVNDFINIIGDRSFYIIHRSPYAAPLELLEMSTRKQFAAHIFINGSVSRRYQQQFQSSNRVVIQNNFNKLERNADYRNTPNELFSEQHLTYRDDGLYGFGDFATIGDKYAEGGGPAHTVAIHLTYEHQASSDIWIRHFLSNTYTVDPDTQEMIQEATQDVMEFLEENQHLYAYSSACAELRDLAESGRNTNLGWIKKVSIKHHIELMTHLLSR